MPPSSTNSTEASSNDSTAPPRRRPLQWFLVAIIFLVIVGSGSWFGLRQIEKRTRTDIANSLTVVATTTRDSLREWFRTERDFAEQLAASPDVVEATRELLAAGQTQDTLLQSTAFRNLRTFFDTRISGRGKLGIFLISPEEVNLFSMRDSNVGVRNLIADQRPGRLRQAFEGTSTLVPPLVSDVPLPEGDQGAAKDPPTMFMATPVKSPQNETLAVLTVRLDPSTDFTRLFHAGRIGVSGETYAFDVEGWMLSESRFYSQLVGMQLVEPGEHSILKVRIADPGRRLTAQSPADLDPAALPLTLMAASAAGGASGRNVDGYRDYRGIHVLGAWIWDDELDFGLTSEIDESEALAVFYSTRTVVATMVGLTVVLGFALAAFLVKGEERKESARRLAEQKAGAESATHAKSEFLAHMSHEIRTPLNAIIGFSQILSRDGSLGEENRRTVRTIERSGNHLLTLINDILEMSKIEAGQLTRNLESIHLRGIAEDMREMMGLKASQKGLQFELAYDESLPGHVEMDSGKFRQIVLNLLSNAIKFTDSGVVRLTFAAAKDPDINAAPSLRVEVADTGPGISREDCEKLFAAFYQSETGRRRQGGTGLGLAISARFAEFLGGDLGLQSEPGKGSTFILRLPLEASKNLEPAAGDRLTSPGLDVVGLDLAPNGKPPRILIAEDQPENRELMERLLGTVGFELKFVEDGRDSVTAVDEWKPDFVWMDLKMPEMNGDEATRLIREKHGDRLPVVALTASALTVEHDTLLEAGFTAVQVKPIRPSEIFATMANFLELRYVTSESEEEPVDSGQAAFNRLANLPDDMKERLREAIDLGDLSGIKACVEEIQAGDPGLAEALDGPLATFAFASILEAMDSPNSTKEVPS